MRLAIYAHPFDLTALTAHGGLRRLADLGFAEVAMATSYHDGRWLMPWHPQGAVRFLEDGTVHFRPSSDYGVLRPQPSHEVPARGDSPLQSLCADAAACGLAVRAWTVYGHNSRLGVAHPELCVQNALGDRYVYTLCPSQAAVREYFVAMTRDLGRHAGLGAVEFEAFGWMGYKHSSHHDKASFAPKGALEQALSLCLCDACATRIAAHGGDPDAVRAWAQAVYAAAVRFGDALQPSSPTEDAAASELLAPVRAARAATVGEVFAAASATLPQGVGRAVQVHPDAKFFGSQMTGQQAAACRSDEVVVTAYGEGPDAIAKLLAHDGMAAFAQRGKRLSIWPKAPQFAGEEDLAKVRVAAESHGVTTIAVYHLGLLPWRTIERAASALTS